jgi:hypothetical protein
MHYEQNTGEIRIRGVLGRLEAVLDDENERLGVDATLNLNHTNALKSRCLYEMTMLLHDAETLVAGPAIELQLRTVQEKLDLNARKVKAHMEAVREVTSLLKDAMAAAEDDGTYSADQFRTRDQA